MYVGPVGNPNVNADQINFQIPAEAPAEGIVPIQVCVEAVCSDPVLMEFTSKDILLRFPGTAYVHMPIWIQVEIPMNPDFDYPFNSCPWDFGGYDFEIRRDGHALSSIPKPECPHRTTGFFNLSRSSKLPLHLFYQFDSPGTYEIRLSGPILTADLTGVARTGYSDWTEITVEAHSEQLRDAWLGGIAKRADKPVEWRQSGDLIPSLLAWPDEKALTTLLRFLPPPPPSRFSGVTCCGLGGPNQVMHCVAPTALAAFSEASLQKTVPAARLKQVHTPGIWCP